MAIYIPPISDYAPFYIQRDIDSSAVNIQTVYGVTVMVHEYPSKRKVKQPYKKDWKDQHGDDEYTAQLFYEAFTLNLKCVIFTMESDSDTARAELKAQVRNFQNAIAQGEFKIYDDWTKYGFQKVRVDEFREIGQGDFASWNGRCRLIFNLVLKVNDPITNMVLSSGKIVEG